MTQNERKETDMAKETEKERRERINKANVEGLRMIYGQKKPKRSSGKKK